MNRQKLDCARLGLPTSTFLTRWLSGLKREVYIPSSRSLTPAVNPPGPFCFMSSHNLLSVSQYLSLVTVVVGRKQEAFTIPDPLFFLQMAHVMEFLSNSEVNS
jgi:hypothetical protein